MGISYAEGGEAKPKKVYVSIRLKYDDERMSEDISDYKKYHKYFYTYDDSNFIELKNHHLLKIKRFPVLNVCTDKIYFW